MLHLSRWMTRALFGAAQSNERRDAASGALRTGVCGAALALVLVAQASVGAVDISDNFSDGNDTANPAWIHMNNVAGSTGQTWEVVNGEYHLNAPGNSTYGTAAGYGFAGSYVNEWYTDVRVTADIKGFTYNGPSGSYFGIGARMNGDNSLPDVQVPPAMPNGTRTALMGYSMQYEPSSGNGEVTLIINHGGGQKDIRSQVNTVLDTAKDYRFVLEVVGDELHGQIFEINAGGGIVTQVANLLRNLATEPAGLGNYDGYSSTPDTQFTPLTGGYSGVYVVGHAFFTPGDAYFDNFLTESLAPLPGDFNGDDEVDHLDLAMWKAAYETTAAGDADGDSDSDGNDFLIWQRNVTGGPPATAAAAAVPEPCAAGLAATAAVVLAGYRRRRTR